MRITIASLALLISNSCFAQEQVKHIGVFVEPYYRAAANAAGTPQVAVARAFDARLSLNEPTKIKEVEAEIRANPDLITPMTLMVLSIWAFERTRCFGTTWQRIECSLSIGWCQTEFRVQ